jgi:integrase/recombinase XerD
MGVDGRPRRGAGPAAIAGPLAPFEPAVRAELVRQGYTPSAARDVVSGMRRLSRWMDQRGAAVSELTPQMAAAFVATRREITSTEQVARRGLGPVLRILRDQRVIPEAESASATSAVEVLLAGYRDYLIGERGLAAESVRCYIVQGRKFLVAVAEPLVTSLAGLDTAAVVSFVIAQTRQGGSTWSAKTLVTATRSLLRFLHVRGLIPVPLAGAVPAVAG